MTLLSLISWSFSDKLTSYKKAVQNDNLSLSLSLSLSQKRSNKEETKLKKMKRVRRKLAGGA